MIDLMISSIRGGIDVLRRWESAEDIERELNAQFNDKTYTLSTHEEEEVDLTVEAIHARPLYLPSKVTQEVAQVEGHNFFTELENERDDPTFEEKFRAMLSGRWITIVRLSINNGNAESICPSGLNLEYVTATTSMRYQGYDDTPEFLTPISPIRVADTNDLQSDKLEVKIRYNRPGDYSERILDSIGLLQEIQDEMQYYTTMYLLDLHDSGKRFGEDEFSWPDEKKARELGNFLFDYPIELDKLEQAASKIKANIIEKQ